MADTHERGNDQDRPFRPDGDERQQPWPGPDPNKTQQPSRRPLVDQERPLEDGVHSDTDRESDPRRTGADDSGEPGRGLVGPPPPVTLTAVKPGEPNTADEAGDVSLQNPADPMLVREDTLNTSTSSGLRADDPADQRLKEQLRRGHQMPSRLD